jgi:hypothetical protein
MKLDNFTLGYLETALWSSNDESTPSGGEPLDRNYTVNDIALETVERAIADCKAFQEANAAYLENYKASTAGHDFWLTRNGHGAGFWDGDYDKADGDALTKASKAYGSVDLYVGDDGKVHSS